MAQKHLAPALLLLYGDVEHTGFYEKIGHRRRIGAVLKYLWSLNSHKPAFRGIATSDAKAPVPVHVHVHVPIEAETGVGITGAEGAEIELDSDASTTSLHGFTGGEASYFIRFANGLMNETNKLVAETLTSLGDIKNTQVLMSQPSWAALDEEERKREQEKLEEAENVVKGSAGLCLETLQVSLSLSLSLCLRLNGLFLYTGGVLCNVECCVR